MPRRPPIATRLRLLAAAALLVVAVAAVAVGIGRGPVRRLANGPCPLGMVPEGDAAAATAAKPSAARRSEADAMAVKPSAPQRSESDAKSGARFPGCQRLGHPESFRDALGVNSQLASRSAAPGSSVQSGAYPHALAQRAALARDSRPVSGANGVWGPLGNTPEVANNLGYDKSNGSTQEGFVNISGRTSDFDRNPVTQALYAAVSNGGVWESNDNAKTWRSIGEGLPTQVVASVKYSPAQGGTLIALTGDNAYGGDSLAGDGVWRSTDDGAHWTQAHGVPGGVLGFRVAADPNNADIVYAATGNGLLRSTDDGQNFFNVQLPTGSCAAHSLDYTNPTYKDCFLANMVTDVVVQGADNPQTPSGQAQTPSRQGAVLAVVGWRSGQKLNADHSMQSPNNGVYTSPDGAPGSFKKVDTKVSKFADGDQSAIGRVALGVASGPSQDHQIVYALVEDANKFNTKKIPDSLDEVPTGAQGSNVFNGVYVSTDFGQNWSQLESATVLNNDLTSGSALEPAGKALGYEPGVQAWYNEWITPDPTVQTDAPAPGGAKGVPTRLFFGLEEVWENKLGSSPQPLDGSAQTLFHVIGRYWNSCDFVVNGAPKCGPGPAQDAGKPNTTTTHPDQHGSLLFPDGGGGVSLLVGNDGGAYLQHVAKGADFSNNGWGAGNNDGFHTLQPYDAAMAKDGTVYAGLQDNGELKILPDGKQFEVFGGDGFFSAVDPARSATAYEEYVGGGVSVTTDGGANWTGINPNLTSALFATPFIMDPTDAQHLMIGGREVKETGLGPSTTSPPSVSAGNPTGANPGTPSPTDWQTVFDLGTQKNAGNAGATSTPEDPNNQLSAVDLRGDSAYVGYCGFCDTITQKVTATAPFASGIATNVGGPQAPKRLTGSGWHIATAKGLPKRYVTSVAMDPVTSSTVYVTLGGYGRRWAIPGAVGDDTSRVGSGHVFKSTDAGASFTDISGDLPDIPADWVTVRGGQLVIATDIGVFASSDTQGSHYSALGSGLPTVPVFHLALKPGDPNTLVAATYGRGVYTYAFPPTSVTSASSTAGVPGGILAAGGRSACIAGARRIRYRINRVPHGRVVKVQVYINGHRVLTRRSRRITHVSFRGPPAAGFAVKVVSTNNRGGRVISKRRYTRCGQLAKQKSHVKRHHRRHARHR